MLTDFNLNMTSQSIIKETKIFESIIKDSCHYCGSMYLSFMSFVSDESVALIQQIHESAQRHQLFQKLWRKYEPIRKFIESKHITRYVFKRFTSWRTMMQIPSNTGLYKFDPLGKPNTSAFLAKDNYLNSMSSLQRDGEFLKKGKVCNYYKKPWHKISECVHSKCHQCHHATSSTFPALMNTINYLLWKGCRKLFKALLQ